jgi:hypothetical protein
VVRTDTGEARVNACAVLMNISAADGIQRDMFLNELLMVSSGVEGSSTNAQES